MIASPLGGLYEVASVAEHEGETEITIDVSLRWRVEAIKAENFVAPTLEFRQEDHEAGPMPRLVKDIRARGLAPPSKAGGMEMCSCKGGNRLELLHISFPYIYIFCRIHTYFPDIYFGTYIIRLGGDINQSACVIWMASGRWTRCFGQGQMTNPGD